MQKNKEIIDQSYIPKKNMETKMKKKKKKKSGIQTT